MEPRCFFGGVGDTVQKSATLLSQSRHPADDFLCGYHKSEF